MSTLNYLYRGACRNLYHDRLCHEPRLQASLFDRDLLWHLVFSVLQDVYYGYFRLKATLKLDR